MRKFDAPTPAFHRLTIALSPSALTDAFTGSEPLHKFDGKQSIASSGALLPQTALLLQQAASQFEATTAVAAQPAVASSSVVLGSVCAVSQLPRQGSGAVLKSLNSLFPGKTCFVFVPHQVLYSPPGGLASDRVEPPEHVECGMLFAALHLPPLTCPLAPPPLPPGSTPYPALPWRTLSPRPCPLSHSFTPFFLLYPIPLEPLWHVALHFEPALLPPAMGLIPSSVS